MMIPLFVSEYRCVSRRHAAKAQSPVPSLFSTPRKAGRSEAEQPEAGTRFQIAP